MSSTAKLRQVSDLVGRPMLRYKDVCKRDMKSAEINSDLWEASAADLSNWRRVIWTGVMRAKTKREQLWHDRREGHEQEKLPYPRYQLRTYAATVTETATQELDFTVTVDAAPHTVNWHFWRSPLSFETEAKETTIILAAFSLLV